MTDHHTHHSPSLDISAIQWAGEPNCARVFDILNLGPHPTPEEEQDHSLIHLPGFTTIHPGDWVIRLAVRAPVADPDHPDAVRRLLEYALATLDRDRLGPDAHLDDTEA